MHCPPISGLWPASPGEAATAGKTEPAKAATQVCRNFEAYFTASMFSAMAKSLDLGQPDGWLKEQSEWVWSGLLQQVAQTLSQGEGLGLARVLEKELARLAEKIQPGG